MLFFFSRISQSHTHTYTHTLSLLFFLQTSTVKERETWMLELPETMRKNFGMGARQFRGKYDDEVCVSLRARKKKEDLHPCFVSDKQSRSGDGRFKKRLD